MKMHEAQPLRTHRKAFTMTELPTLARIVEERGGETPSPIGGPYAAAVESLRSLRARGRQYASLPTGAPDLHLNVSPRPHGTRWIMLFYLSALAMLSDWICFSAAPIPKLVQRNFGLHDSHLVTCFLATNVCFCLLEPATVRAIGMRRAVVGGAVAMALGCALRWFASLLANGGVDDTDGLVQEGVTPELVLVVVGTMLVGAAQPFFQCTPSLLAANWFAENETTLAATVALNANQLGIAASYAIGASCVHTDAQLQVYLGSIALIAAVLALGAAKHFRARPSLPPSFSALQSIIREDSVRARSECFDSLRREQTELTVAVDDAATAADDDADDAGEATDDFTVSPLYLEPPEKDAEPAPQPAQRRPVRRWLVSTHRVGHGSLDIFGMRKSTNELLAFKGFDACLAAFVASIVASNLVSTFLPHLVEERSHLQGERHTTTLARIAALGAGFQVAIMCGSLAIGATVDATKRYKSATVFAFGASTLALCFIARKQSNGHALEIAVLCLGFFIGPIQPLTAELAVEVTHPDGDENTIVALQQTCGNLFSAAAVPLFLRVERFARARDWDDRSGLRVEYVALATLVTVCAAFFATRICDATLKRCEQNSESAAAVHSPGSLDAQIAAASGDQKNSRRSHSFNQSMFAEKFTKYLAI